MTKPDSELLTTANDRPVRIFAILRNLFLVSSNVVLLTVALGVFGVWRASTGFISGIAQLWQNPQPEAQVDVETLVLEQVRGASELTTALFTMQAVVPTERDRTFAGYTIGKTTLLYLGHGEVRAGVDLSQIDADDIAIVGDQIQITLPPPQILDSKVDVTRSRVYDYDRGFLGLGPDAAPELHELAQQRTLQEIETAACQQELLLEANDRAEEAVTQLLAAAGQNDVVVRTQTPNAAECLVASPALPRLKSTTSSLSK